MSPIVFYFGGAVVLYLFWTPIMNSLGSFFPKSIGATKPVAAPSPKSPSTGVSSAMEDLESLRLKLIAAGMKARDVEEFISPIRTHIVILES